MLCDEETHRIYCSQKISAMLLYKFKTLDPFVHIVDLLLTRRLYCPSPHELNDPLEGVLVISLLNPPSSPTAGQSFERAFRFWSVVDQELDRYRLCCFSESPESLLMWSHYGNGHSGICLELDLAGYEDKIVPVEYLADLAPLECASVGDQLRYKAQQWSYEKEYRLILPRDSELKYVQPSIKAVLIGAGIKSDYIRPLFELCRLMKYQREIVSFSTTGTFLRVPLNDAAWDEGK